ncbi:MAG: hypothetical protein HC764_12450 [Pleurocapsa sp. CRU_1_2]|nr:hypothetical protein [Pleurocapsa sp. CRU_1_2]
MTKNNLFVIAQAQTTEAIATPPSEQKLWKTELFQLSAMGGILALLMIWASLNQKKPQLTSARMANRWDKLYATNRALEHMEATARSKCSPSAAWCGTPKYSYKFLGLNGHLDYRQSCTTPCLLPGFPILGEEFSF